jgi:uncharacterized repeat protein (TIGR02543 family)
MNELKHTCMIWLLISLLIMQWPLYPAIARSHDPLIIQGQSVPDYVGQSIKNIAVYRYSASTEQWESLLFQIDELDETQLYFGEKDGLLSLNDEIVFLARDLGDQAPQGNWPDDDNARHARRYEVLVTDPIDLDSTGYAYLFYSETLEKRSDSYFRYSEDEDWITTPTYTAWHAQHGFQAGLYLNTSAGGDSINIVERQKFRVIGRVLGTNDVIPITEEMDEDISLLNGLASIHAYVGPKSIQYVPGGTVRQHRYLELEYRLNGKILTYDIDKQGSYQFLTTFYPTFAEWKSGNLTIDEIENVNIREVRVTTDLRGNAWGMQFYNPYNFDPPIRVDKTTDDYDHTLPWPGNSWHMIVANPDDPDKRVNHATLLTVTKIPTVPTGTTGQFYLKDSQDRVDYDTGDDKSWGDSGFQMKSPSIIGSVNFYCATYYLPQNLTYAQGENLAAHHLNPLQIEMSPQVLTFQVTTHVLPDQAGEVLISPPGSEVPAYSTIELTASPNPGYVFSGWNGDLVSTENPVSLNMDSDKTVTAQFEPKLVDITLVSEPQGLHFLVDGEEVITPHRFSWQENTVHSISADSIIDEQENLRWAFTTWNPENPRAFELQVTDIQQYKAFYHQEYKLSVATENPEMGQTAILSGMEWYPRDSIATCMAEPALNYSFSHWSGDTVSQSTILTLPMIHAWNVIAHFSNAPPVITAMDTTIAEDDTLTLSSEDFERWVNDDSTPLSSLTFMFAGSDVFSFSHDAESGQLQVIPEMNWFGSDTIWVTATDPIGASTRAPLLIHVLSRPDSPQPFKLVSPADGTDFTEWPSQFEFTWEHARDPDPGDTVSYIFELDSTDSFQSPAKITIVNIQWNQYILLWPHNLNDGTYYWRILARDQTGNTTSSSVYMLSMITAVAQRTESIPEDYMLEQNYPNPFNGRTSLRIGLPEDTELLVTVFNSHGQRVKNLWHGQQKAGYHTLVWEGRNDHGESVSSGTYIILFKTPNRQIVRKALLLQ